METPVLIFHRADLSGGAVAPPLTWSPASRGELDRLAAQPNVGKHAGIQRRQLGEGAARPVSRLDPVNKSRDSIRQYIPPGLCCAQGRGLPNPAFDRCGRQKLSSRRHDRSSVLPPGHSRVPWSILR